MVEKFDPAPFDKYADNPAAVAAARGKNNTDLSSGLEGSFPASDPPSSTQPAPSERDAAGQTLWRRFAGLFK
jgi:hypothetical protein